MDVPDRDPVSFWSHVLAAIESVLPSTVDEPAMLLAERGADDPLFLDGLAMLVDQAGAALRIVLTTRVDPRLPLARWRSMGWLNERPEADLRFTDDEAVRIAAQLDPAPSSSAPLEPDHITRLNHRVDGWPIGLHMAILSRRQGGTEGGPEGGPPTTGSTTSDRVLATYLVAGVLDSMTDEERDVELSLSVVQWFDPQMCRDLAGPRGRGRGPCPARPGSVPRRRGPSGVDHAVPHLFRELLEVELRWRDPARRMDLHRRAAVVWRSRGDLMAAYQHLAAIGEDDKAHGLLIGPALDHVDRGDLAALHDVAHQLPTTRDVDEADHWIRQAEQIDAPAILVSVTVPTLRAWHEWLFGRLDQATRLVEGAVAWLEARQIGAHHHAFDTSITAVGAG